MTFNIKEELKKLPDQPGVYIMHDASDAIIYVGKAVSLRNRVRQYFQACHDEGIKKDQMVKKITRFEYIITDSELEALVLECNLIKEYRPKYNTMLRDDKTYPYIRVTLGEEYPRVLFCRQMKKDKARYFGPYTSSQAVRDTIDLIHKLYHIRSCNRSLPKDIGKERPCLNYHIKQCEAPCQGYISKEEYGEQIKKAISFLNGNYNDMIKELTGKMTEAAEEMRFEQAAALRDRINAIGALGGAIEDMPRYAATIGIREILGAKRVCLGVFREWHRAVVRRAACGEVSASFPVTLLQNHPDARIYANHIASERPV